MIPILSVVTSVKDYLEVVHKLIEYDSDYFSNYTELGPILTYFVLSLKNFFIDFISLSWLKNIWSLPILIPDISSAMISEISVLDGYFHNAFHFLETPVLSPSEKTIGFLSGLEKFTIGLLNSCFLFLPTSTAHIITLRRFVMQGIDAGFVSGLGTIAGNLFWIASVILGWRFFVIPWLSLDILRYILGFVLLVKYMWDSSKEQNMVLEDLSKRKIFLFNFLLALTEQTSIYPFISNISISPEASILESFPADNYLQFLFIHISYLFGIGLGSFCLLQFTCWFWENPAFKLYMWFISSFKVSKSFYSKSLNFIFLYLTMLSAINSIPYYGLDYTITKPLGFVNDDRLIQDKTVLETSFLGNKASDRNTRRNRGRHGRRERWKRRIRKYRTFDTSLYDQGIYDLFTVEDLNYGFDRFWLRRKLRNHRVRFRFFPGPWMRSFKKQLAKPRLESYTGPRIEFFRILFEQVYHPAFHARNKVNNPSVSVNNSGKDSSSKGGEILLQKRINKDSQFIDKDGKLTSISTVDGLSPNIKGNYAKKQNLIQENSMLRKFVRKLDTRLKTSEIVNDLITNNGITQSGLTKALTTNSSSNNNIIYSKRWKEILNKTYHEPKTQISTSNILFKNVHRNLYNSSLKLPKVIPINLLDSLDEKHEKKNLLLNSDSIKKQSARIQTLSNKDLQILRYRSMLTFSNKQKKGDLELLNAGNDLSQFQFKNQQPILMLHPLKFYLQQEAALQRKLRYYTPNIFRKFSIENNAPYFRVMMRRYFYNYKPTNRWERTMKIASLRKARRKTTRTPRKLRLPQIGLANPNITGKSTRVNENEKNVSKNMTFPNQFSENNLITPFNDNLYQRIQKPTYNYSVVSKKASRYRYQIYKDVMQHWYYSPFNRLLLKFDVDNFIRRQPKTHFLTSKEENLLHLRRFFLSEHYNTLRWYTNMEHYRTMKTKIGGNKSFSSRAYNQQFSGTFKKIRHLFSITPAINTMFSLDEQLDNNALSLGASGQKTKNLQNNVTQLAKQDSTVLKFDQPLYNEYPNNSQNPLLNPLIIHEELLNSPNTSKSYNSSNPLPFQDLLSQSQKIVGEYLTSASQLRKDYMKELLNNNDFSTLTLFLYNGQKLRGNKPITNQKLLGSQEKEYLLTSFEKDNIEKQYNSPEIKRILRQNIDLLVSGTNINNGDKNKQLVGTPYLENLYLTFLKNWKHRVNNQESLKNYLGRRIDKREKRKINKEKSLQNKIKTLNDWVNNVYKTKTVDLSESSLKKQQDKKISSDIFLSSISNKNQSQSVEYLTSGLQKAIDDGIKTANKDITSLQNRLDSSTEYNNLSVKNLDNLNNVQKQKLQKEIQITTNKLSQILKQLNNKSLSVKTVTLLKKKVFSILQRLKIITYNFSSVNFNKVTYLFKPIKQKSLQNWRKKQRVIGKQKRLRKEFKLLLTKKQTSQSTALVIPNRKKRIDSQKQGIDNSEPSVLQTSSNLHNILENNTTEKTSFFKNNYFTSFFNFKRERSPQRRYRVRRNRGVFRKRNLGDLIKNDIKIFSSKTKTSNLSLSPEDINVRRSFYSKISSLFGRYPPQRGKEESARNKTEKTLENQLVEQDLRSSTKDSMYFVPSTVKQRKNKQRKLRSWKQKRMPLRASQKRRKYLKRRRYSISKVRVLSKQFKRIKNKLEKINWWWKQYLPSIQASTDALWQIEKDKLIQQKLSELSSIEIMERDSINFNKLQIGNKDFKPLALPEAMRINSNLNKKLPVDSLNTKTECQSPVCVSSDKNPILQNSDTVNKDLPEKKIVNQLYENLFINQKDSTFQKNGFGLLPNTTLPFYAGWDESLRKFVVTNRLLSRQEAGYEVDSNFIMKKEEKNNLQLNDSFISTKEKFTEAPLQGMNAATTLYWQIPFTTYDPDQFFALGMDGFSPIAWRKMLFRHSILKSWLGDQKRNDYNSNSQSFNSKTENSIENLSQKFSMISIKKTYNHQDLLSTLTQIKNNQTKKFNTSNSQDGFNISRRLKKRLLRVKKHPRTPVWFPSGPLLNQVLPVHYIYVFYKRSRLPRNRYLGRRLLNVNTINNSETLNILKSSNSFLYNYDFTLRKRLKPKRKYHLKHDTSIVIPRRLKFLNLVKQSSISNNIPNKPINGLSEDIISSQVRINPLIRWRPLSSKKINKSFSDLMNEQKALRTKRQQRLTNAAQTDQPSLRVKQLKRRVQRTIIRSIWRYRPRAGGFVWPGDYLKLELVKAPKLKNISLIEENLNKETLGITDKAETYKNKERNNVDSLQNIDNTLKRKTSRKKKRNLVEWQIQPKKYLYEKHNIKVLKKKLERCNRSGSIIFKKKLNELKSKL